MRIIAQNSDAVSKNFSFTISWFSSNKYQSTMYLTKIHQSDLFLAKNITYKRLEIDKLLIHTSSDCFHLVKKLNLFYIHNYNVNTFSCCFSILRLTVIALEHLLNKIVFYILLRDKHLLQNIRYELFLAYFL